MPCANGHDSRLAFDVLPGFHCRMAGQQEHASAGQEAWFATTHWSVVLAAKGGGSRQADAAMEKLCRAYWALLYAYIRREGHGVTEAQDLTQEFFARLLAKDYLRHLRHQEPTHRLLANPRPFAEETFALAAFGPLWWIEREPEGKL